MKKLLFVLLSTTIITSQVIWLPATAEKVFLADYDGNGVVNSTDAALINLNPT